MFTTYLIICFVKFQHCADVCRAYCTYRGLVEVQQDEHLHCANAECQGAKVELSVSQPRPLETTRLRQTQTVQTLAWTDTRAHRQTRLD